MHAPNIKDISDDQLSLDFEGPGLATRTNSYFVSETLAQGLLTSMQPSQNSVNWATRHSKLTPSA